MGPTVVLRSISCLRKMQPGGTTLQVKESLPIREEELSFGAGALVVEVYDGLEDLLFVVHCDGSHHCQRMPRKVRVVEGPSWLMGTLIYLSRL